MRFSSYNMLVLTTIYRTHGNHDLGGAGVRRDTQGAHHQHGSAGVFEGHWVGQALPRCRRRGAQHDPYAMVPFHGRRRIRPPLFLGE